MAPLPMHALRLLRYCLPALVQPATAPGWQTHPRDEHGKEVITMLKVTLHYTHYLLATLRPRCQRFCWAMQG
jgi:hypothetical protein